MNLVKGLTAGTEAQQDWIPGCLYPDTVTDNLWKTDETPYTQLDGTNLFWTLGYEY